MCLLTSIVYKFLRYMSDHFGVVVMFVGLIFNIFYLCKSGRLHSIGLGGWGDCKRSERPILFYFVWFIYLVMTLMFAIVVIGSVMGYASSF